MKTFQEILGQLKTYWEEKNCVIHQGYDCEVGAGTFNPATFLRCMGPEPYRAVYVEPCRRPSDGRYGENPNRIQHYYQCQVVIKPSPLNIQELYLESLKAIGLDLSKHDIRFVHDDWENPTIGAWGLGWEVWIDGMEVTQFTYFQSLGGLPLKPVTVELTYGLERLAMYLQNVDSIFDLQWDKHLTYRDIYHRNEVEWSHYNFEQASTEMWFRHFNDFEAETERLIKCMLPLPAYDFVMKASHAFNILDARGAISVTERTGYITRIRNLARKIAEGYLASREEQDYPLLQAFPRHKTEETAASPEVAFEASPEKQEDFLLEIGSEELPATFVPIGMRNLEKALCRLLDEADITYKEVKTYGTPRRLTLYIRDLALGKAPKQEKRKGPAISKAFDDKGMPTKAAEGFFRSIGLTPAPLQEIKQNPMISIEEVKGNDYLFVEVTIPGLATGALLQEKLPNLIENLDFPKKMHWGDLDITYARPLQWIVALLGADVVPFQVGNIHSNRDSFGHRQLCNERFSIAHSTDYLSTLKKHSVIADQTEREKMINDQLNENVICREQVMPQVLYLSEHPHVITGTFDRDFLQAPKEVLISEMVEHQKYFPVAESSGELKNSFIIVSDNKPNEEIRIGNERVLSARLADGVFLYNQGLKHSLLDYTEKLKHVTYQKDLGSVYDKVERLVCHAKTLQEALQISTPEKASRAAQLSKADLASEMVYEFPELQGTIGKYYAQKAGEDQEVAVAIEEQWMPRGEQAPLPKTDTGIILSLTEKLDNLIGCFSVGLKPTSSSDPYALRRQALGFTKILINNQLHLNLPNTLKQCQDHFPENIRSDNGEVIGEIQSFLTNRIKTVFLDYDFAKDEIEAALSHGFTDIYDAFRRVEALHQFRGNQHFSQLFEVYKRAKGQISNHEQGDFSTTLLKEEAEKKLDYVLTQMESSFSEALKERNYDQAYSLLAKIQPALANLFDNVKILDDDLKIRNNRIALLQKVFGLFATLLDFSKIQE